MLGPIDYITVGFKGNNFDGSILRELTKAIDEGIIRLIDLVFIIKDKNGDVAMAEITDTADDLKDVTKRLDFKDDMPLLTDEDIQKLGTSMKKNTSAGVLVIEHLWAIGLKKALIDAGGILLDEGRIHPVVVEAALKDLEKSKAKARGKV